MDEAGSRTCSPVQLQQIQIFWVPTYLDTLELLIRKSQDHAEMGL